MVPFLACSVLLIKLIKKIFLLGPGFRHLAGPGRELGPVWILGTAHMEDPTLSIFQKILIILCEQRNYLNVQFMQKKNF